MKVFPWDVMPSECGLVLARESKHPQNRKLFWVVNLRFARKPGVIAQHDRVTGTANFEIALVPGIKRRARRNLGICKILV